MRRATPLITLAATLLALPAASQQGKAPPTNLYIDVATHNMAGMPYMGAMMGGLGGFMAKRMGGNEAFKPTYPSTRAAGMTGQYLDIALHNALKPGVEAQDQVPSGLNLGRSLTLLPPEPASVDAWIAQAEDNSPEVRALQARVDAAQAEIDKAKGGHYPTLDAVAQISRSASENVNSPRSRNTNHMLGLQLTVPLFSGGYTQSTVRQALAEQVRAQETLEATRRDQLTILVHLERAITGIG